MKTLAAAVVMAAFIASPALAHRTGTSPFNVQVAAPDAVRGATTPIYSGGRYVGQDPDIRIRSDLRRQGSGVDIGGGE